MTEIAALLFSRTTSIASERVWRRQHAGHHANWNNLDRRASGVDIYSDCMTVAEYRRMPRWRRLVHRVALHPVVSLLLLPPLVFLALYRLPFDAPAGWEHERRAVQYTNVALLASMGQAVSSSASFQCCWSFCRR